MSRFYNDFVNMCGVLMKHSNLDVSRFDRLIESNGDCDFEGIYIHGSKVSSIKRFYEKTNLYNRTKIVELINNNVSNFEKVHKIVIDYETIKTQKG